MFFGLPFLAMLTCIADSENNNSLLYRFLSKKPYIAFEYTYYGGPGIEILIDKIRSGDIVIAAGQNVTFRQHINELHNMLVDRVIEKVSHDKIVIIAHEYMRNVLTYNQYREVCLQEKMLYGPFILCRKEYASALGLTKVQLQNVDKIIEHATKEFQNIHKTYFTSGNDGMKEVDYVNKLFAKRNTAYRNIFKSLSLYQRLKWLECIP